MSTQIETLTESRSQILQIGEKQAAALSAVGRQLRSNRARPGFEDEDPANDDRTVISCQMAAAGRFRVTVRNAVGVIAIDGLQIEVRPKINQDHFFWIISKSMVIPRMDSSRAALHEGQGLWELVARWFTSELSTVLKHDLIRDYRTELDDLTAARGRVMPLATARSYYSGRLTFSCEYDIFDADTPANRLLKAAARAVLSSPLGSDEVRTQARRLLSAMDDVGPLRIGDAEVPLDTRAAHYGNAHSLARQIVSAKHRTMQHGAELAWSFLIPTPALIESGLRECLREGLAATHAVTKNGRRIGSTGLSLNPDLVFDNGVAVGDVKYKLNAGTWRREDLYQVTTFATGYRATIGAVIDFAPSPVPRPLPDLRIGEVTLRALHWNCDPERSPQLSESQLIEDARRWLEAADTPDSVPGSVHLVS